MKNNTILLYFFSIAFFCVFPVFGQRSYVKGPTQVPYKNTSTYLVMGASNTSDAQWGAQGGTIQNSTPTSASIKWDGESSNGTVYFNSSSTGTLTLAVNITDVPPRIPANPTITNTGCTKATLSRNGTPPSGVTWYWQGKNSNGTSTNLGSGSTYTAQQGSGTYYIKARNSNGIWSEGSGAVHVTIPDDLLNVPPLPSIKNNCGNTVLTRGTPPGGITWYWQSSAGGTSTSNSSASITRTSGTVYYLRARHNSSGCWSAARTINYTVTPEKTWYADADGDSFGDPSDTKVSCTKPAGYVERAGDNCPDVYGDANGCPDENYKAITLSNENYIYTRSYQKGMTTPGEIEKNEDVLESVVYYDGLGRPKQEVVVRQSPGMHDVVRYIGYDAFGRQDKDYLPFVPDPAQGGYGTFRTGDIAGSTAAYYLERYGPDFTGMNVSQANAYSQKEFEASPLNRVEKQAAPGKDWKLGNGHEIEFGYGTNTVTEVRLFKVSFVNGNPEAPKLEAVANKHYGAGQLYKTITRDENHSGTTKDHTTEEFKDKQGRVVLKRTYNNGSQHNTFYVYDDYGNLTYVIPPKVNISNAITATVLDELCYQYKYDGRNRLIEKKVPGKGWEYIVYNMLDQPVMTQDASLKAQNKWLFTKYDAFGRVAYTGTVNHTGSRAALQNSTNNVTTYDQYEARTPGVNTYAGTPVYYSNAAIPKGLNDEIHMIHYYDNYTFDLAGLTVPTTVLGQTVDTRTKTLATGSKTRVLGTNHWITTISAYDKKGRLIYTAAKNPYLNTTDIVENRLDFVGKVLESKTTHTKGSNTGIVTVDKFTYDHAGRLLTHTQKIGNQSEELIAENVYDDLGQLKEKRVGNTSNKPLQEVKYAYNVRGWLKGINDADNLGNNLFGFRINYNTPQSGVAPALYNGNIAETYWKTSNDNTLRRYAYTYDALNRITSGLFNGSGQTDRYTVEGIAYDKNGNITALKRNGHLNAGATSFGLMDDLSYAYHNGGNFLVKVSDAANKTYGFKDGSNTDNDYARDANGNTIRDRNKGITDIAYNHLNLPTQVSLGSNKIAYIYDASGSKLKKTVTEGSSVTNTEYAGNYIYENGQLKQVSHTEGYFEPKAGGGYQYVYYLKDHLNNVRITFADDNGDGVVSTSEIRREQNYYPFGLEHKGYNGGTYGVKNNLKTYQDQEFTEDLGLNTHGWKYRVSDPAIGRFWQVDPLAEDYPYNGVYNFSENRVVDGWELEGLEFYPMNNPYHGRSENIPNEETLKQGASIGSDFTPVIGDIKGFIEAFTGTDLGTGEELGTVSRLLGAVFLSELRSLGKAGDVVKTTEKTVENASDAQKTYQTYTKVNSKTGEVYSGKTSGTGTPAENIAKRDASHHMNDKGFGKAQLDQSSTNKDAIRGREQQLIDANGGAKSQGGTSGNAINGVSPKNPKAEQYRKAAEKEFGGS